MSRVHVVQLALELQTKLDLLLMVLRILLVVLFEFESHLSLVHSLPLELLTEFMLSVQVFLEDLLVVCLLLRLLLVLFVKSIKLSLVLLANLTDQHTVVSPAAVFEQDGEDLPDIGYHGVLLPSVLETLLDELIEANRIYEERPVDSVDQIVLDTCFPELKSIDTVTRNWILVLRLEDHTWDIEVLCVIESLIDPCLKDLVGHLHLPVLRCKASVLWLYFALIELGISSYNWFQSASH